MNEGHPLAGSHQRLMGFINSRHTARQIVTHQIEIEDSTATASDQVENQAQANLAIQAYQATALWANDTSKPDKRGVTTAYHVTNKGSFQHMIIQASKQHAWGRPSSLPNTLHARAIFLHVYLAQANITSGGASPGCL